MSVLRFANIPALAANGGLKNSHVPFLDLGGRPVRDMRTGKIADEFEEVMQRARYARLLFLI